MPPKPDIVCEITPEAIRSHMARVLASAGFARSRRMQRFLEHIVEETLAGRADQLGEYGIGIAVFDRPPDFEPALDPIVRNDARRLRLKLLESYLHLPPTPSDQLRIDIPKGGYVPVFHTAPPGPLSVTTASAATRPLLSVLPFEMLPETSKSTLCSRALSMSLAANLTNLDDLEVRVQQLCEPAELHLTHVIHGCILESNGHCRVVINLTQLSGGIQIWARQYELALADILPATCEIAASASREITTALGLRQQQPQLVRRAA